MSNILRKIKSTLRLDQIMDDRVPGLAASTESTEQKASILPEATEQITSISPQEKEQNTSNSSHPDETIFATPENSSFYSKKKYNDLDPASHKIRLMNVHPHRLRPRDLVKVFPQWTQDSRTDAHTISSNQDSQDFICASLIEDVGSIAKRSPLKYSALSYCAGSASNVKRIMIDGYWFNAFANLEHSLERFRVLHDPKSNAQALIWTDQVCINQSNYEEKAH